MATRPFDVINTSLPKISNTCDLEKVQGRQLAALFVPKNLTARGSKAQNTSWFVKNTKKEVGLILSFNGNLTSASSTRTDCRKW